MFYLLTYLLLKIQEKKSTRRFKKWLY